jgi:hypothetical protein
MEPGATPPITKVVSYKISHLAPCATFERCFTRDVERSTIIPLGVFICFTCLWELNSHGCKECPRA